MPDWIWLIALFLMLTIGCLIGFVCGTWKSVAETNPCPSENAYIREVEIMAEANKEIEIRKAELEAQNEMERYKISVELVERERTEKEKQNNQNVSS